LPRGLRKTIKISDKIMKPIGPGFPRDSPGFMGFKDLCPSDHQNSVWDGKCDGYFQATKNMKFLAILTKNFDFSHRGRKIFTGAEQPSKTMRKLRRLVITESGLRLSRMRTGHAKKNQ
jgi:hypothetical protein